MNGAEDTQCEKYFTPPEKHIFKEEIINKAHQIIEKNLVADGDKHFLSFDGLDELFTHLDDALNERLDGKLGEIVEIIEDSSFYHSESEMYLYQTKVRTPKDKAEEIIKLIREGQC